MLSGYLVFGKSTCGSRYSRNWIGDTGYPWRMPLCMWLVGSVWPSKSKPGFSMLRKLSTHHQRGWGGSFCIKVCRSSFRNKLANAPFTSIQRDDTVRALCFALSNVLAMSMQALTADHFGLPAICHWWRRWCHSKIQVSLVAMIFTDSLPRLLSRDIGR